MKTGSVLHQALIFLGTITVTEIETVCTFLWILTGINVDRPVFPKSCSFGSMWSQLGMGFSCQRMENSACSVFSLKIPTVLKPVEDFKKSFRNCQMYLSTESFFR